MTRGAAQRGYLIRNLGTSVQVIRPGEADPAFIVPTVPEALDLVAIDMGQLPSPLLRCVGCPGELCGCMPESAHG